MRAVTVVGSPGKQRLALQDHETPLPRPHEVTVAVDAISLNNGEIRDSLSSSAGYRPGWDLAGVVETAPVGSKFSVGDRVVGLKFEGAWAELVAIPPTFLALVADEVSFEAAAVLPVAGLTATIALSKKALSSGDKVLVTAATGGVGLLAVQLAAAAGAHVTSLLRREEDAALLARLGAHAVAIGQEEAARKGPYDLILEGVGGQLLGKALTWLSPRGVCVQFGDAGGDNLTTFDAKAFRLGPGGVFGGTSLYGFFLGEELTNPKVSAPSRILADLVSRLKLGTLDPVIMQT